MRKKRHLTKESEFIKGSDFGNESDTMNEGYPMKESEIVNKSDTGNGSDTMKEGYPMKESEIVNKSDFGNGSDTMKEGYPMKESEIVNKSDTGNESDIMKESESINESRPGKEKYSIKKYRRENLRAIQDIVQRKTGAAVAADRGLAGNKIRRMAVLAGSLLCLVISSAFAYAKFSGLNGDEAGFAAVYLGDGRFDIAIINVSDRELELQEKIKVMQWSTGEEVEGDSRKIRMQGMTIAPHSQGVISIDISEGYDVEAMMEEELQDGDGYYFVLTNNNFAFGQDWMVFFDFEVRRTEDVMAGMGDSMEQRAEREREKEEEKQYRTGELMDPAWIWPTVSREVSGSFGVRENGIYSDHVNICGTAGDEIYAVADGVVKETAFEASAGNFIIVDLGEGVTVKYGHLKEIKVSEGEEIKQGQVIAEMGRTGTATGPNLLLGVSVDGEEVNPFAE